MNGFLQPALYRIDIFRPVGFGGFTWYGSSGVGRYQNFQIISTVFIKLLNGLIWCGSDDWENLNLNRTKLQMISKSGDVNRNLSYYELHSPISSQRKTELIRSCFTNGNWSILLNNK